MAKEFAKAFYNAKPWLRCREAYIKKRIMIDGGLCERCHERQGYIVHHRIGLTADNIGDPGISLSHGNLMYVCKLCHDDMDGHGVSKPLTPRVLFDADGNAIGTAGRAQAPP